MQSPKTEVKECGALAVAADMATIIGGVASVPIAIKVVKDAINKVEGK